MSKNSDRESAPHRRKKNTKRWCKGKEGVEHTPVWEADTRFRFADWRVFVCQRCRKRLDLWITRIWANQQEEVPPEIGSTEPRRGR